MSDWRRRSRILLYMVVTGFAGAACTEKLENGASCPALCPNQAVTVRDTIIEAVVFDTTVSGFPVQGGEQVLLVSARGDTLQTVGVLRFDIVPTSFARSATDTVRMPITVVSGSRLRLRLDRRSGTGSLTGPLTVDVFDVDIPTTAEEDTTAAVLRPLLRADRRVGGVSFTATDSLRDTLIIPLDTAFVQARLTAGRRIRLGLRVSGAASAELAIFSREAGLAPQLVFDPTPADTGGRVTISVLSLSPIGTDSLAAELADYAVVLSMAGGPPPGDSLLAVGGLPASRAVLRFVLDSAFLASVNILRATLILEQRPSFGAARGDSIGVQPLTGIAGTRITDLRRVATLARARLCFDAGCFSRVQLDSTRTTPQSAGPLLFEVIGLVRQFQVMSERDVPRVIVLQSTGESSRAGQLLFYSRLAANPLQRPRLRLSYVTRTEFGLP